MNAIPLDEERPYLGKHVAWEWTRIVDGDEDWATLWKRLADNGHDPQQCPVE